MVFEVLAIKEELSIAELGKALVLLDLPLDIPPQRS
jgi:hypothetical protein